MPLTIKDKILCMRILGDCINNIAQDSKFAQGQLKGILKKLEKNQ